MKPGDVFPVLLWTYHSFTGIGPALLLEVSTPCVISDNYFENTAIPIGGNYRSIRRAALLRGNLRGTDAQKRVPPRTE